MIDNIPSVAHVIQQALTPVFLLGGVCSFLSVLTGRLGRVVDRFRVLQQLEQSDGAAVTRELLIMPVRVKLINWAIIMTAICAFLVCISIITLFVGAEVGINLSRVISVLFILAITAFSAGLLCFLREIGVAIGPIKVDDVC